jgi:hypothetical protein
MTIVSVPHVTVVPHIAEAPHVTVIPHIAEPVEPPHIPTPAAEEGARPLPIGPSRLAPLPFTTTHTMAPAGVGCGEITDDGNALIVIVVVVGVAAIAGISGLIAGWATR